MHFDISKRTLLYRIKMKQQYARVTLEMPENKEKKSLHQELTYEIENPDINDEYTVKF